MPCRFEDHPTVPVTSVHSLVAIARNGWSRSIGTPGRNQLEQVVAITRCAHDTFGDHCDRIFVENFAPCWPNFDIEEHTGIKISKGIYQQDIGDTDTCPYIFYGYSVNADGLVSSCFLDWGRKLIIGDVRQQSMKEIWNSDKMNALRLQHLEGRRRQNGICGNCGQLSHCLPDSIDAHRPALLKKFIDVVNPDRNVVAPGGTRKVVAEAAE